MCRSFESNEKFTCKAWLVCPNLACMNPSARSPAWNLPVLAADDAPLMPSAPFPALPKEMIIIWQW